MKDLFQTLKRRLTYIRSLPKGARREAYLTLSKHPYAVPILTVGSLLLLSGMVFGVIAIINRNDRPVDSKIVIISHDKMRQVVPSRKQTVAELLKKVDIPLNEGDVVEPSLNTVIDQDQFRVNIYRALPVEIVDGQSRTYAFSAASTPRSIATQSGSSIYSEDIVSQEPVQDFLRTGAIGRQVIIDRAQPVNLNLYGTMVNLRTHADTVGELMQQRGIKLAKDDQVVPAADTLITPNTQIFIVRKGIKIKTETQTIAMPVQNIQDASLSYGTSAVRQQGSPGEQIVTYQDELENGKVVRSSVVQTVVTKPPVTQIVVVGTSLSGIKGDMARAGIAPSDYNYADYIISHESGWCPTKAYGQSGSCPGTPTGSTSGPYGLCQASPGTKMASAGSDWLTNPVTQLRWCSGYATGHYGSWKNAYDFWVSHRYW